MALTVTLALIAAVIHIYIFVLESLVFTKPLGRKVFRMDEATAKSNRLFAFNQGFYNLLLAVGILYGIYVGDTGRILVDFCMFSIFVAGLVLLCSEPKLYRGALLQAVPAFIYLVVCFLF